MVGSVVSRNPATGEEIFRLDVSGTSEIRTAVERAGAAQPRWAATLVGERAGVLRRFAELVDRHAAELSALITREVGKRRAEADAEAEWTAISARWYAEHPPVDERWGGALVRRQPLGVIAAITPWNVPLVTCSWKWLPALMAGNTVVWKPSESATATAFRAAELFAEAGLPPGALQVVPGAADTAAALCEDPQVAGVHFTGSTAAGRAISTLVAPRAARCALEMGGVNTAVVFPDADLTEAAGSIVASATAINGQKCTSIRRVLVHEASADKLVENLAGCVDALVPGDPADAGTTLGPLISARARQHADSAVSEAEARGATIIARSSPTPNGNVDPSSFFPMTILEEDQDGWEDQEVFAPLVMMHRFYDLEEVWRLAASGGHGLAAAVYTEDTDLVRQASDRLPVGVLAVNRRSDAVDLEAPFGGRRSSGNGFPEGGSFAYSAVTDIQAVYGT